MAGQTILAGLQSAPGTEKHHGLRLFQLRRLRLRLPA